MPSKLKVIKGVEVEVWDTSFRIRDGGKVAYINNLVPEQFDKLIEIAVDSYLVGRSHGATRTANAIRRVVEDPIGEVFNKALPQKSPFRPIESQEEVDARVGRLMDQARARLHGNPYVKGAKNFAVQEVTQEAVKKLDAYNGRGDL